jgi:hypothetical protein
MGGFVHAAAGSGRHGAPRIVVVNRFTFWGGVFVRRRCRKRTRSVTSS